MFLLVSGGPLNVSIFHWEVVACPSSPMTNLVEVFMFQGNYTPLLCVTDFVGLWAVIVPVSPKCAAILITMSLGLSGKFVMMRGQGVSGVFFVKH